MLNIDKLKHYVQLTIETKFISHFVGTTFCGGSDGLTLYSRVDGFKYIISMHNKICYDTLLLLAQIFNIPLNKKDIKTLEMLTHKYINPNLILL